MDVRNGTRYVTEDTMETIDKLSSKYHELYQRINDGDVISEEWIQKQLDDLREELSQSYKMRAGEFTVLEVQDSRPQNFGYKIDKSDKVN